MSDPDKSTATRLQATSDAGTEGLRDYVESMRVENVTDALGEGAKSNLASSLVVATFGIAVLLLVGTLPYMYSLEKTTKKPATPTTEANGETPAVDPNANPANPATPTDSANSGTPNANPAAPTDAETARAATALGIDETKEADPNTNPLDNLNNLLDGVK